MFVIIIVFEGVEFNYIVFFLIIDCDKIKFKNCDVRVFIIVLDGYMILGDFKWFKVIIDNSIWILYLLFLFLFYKFLSFKVFRFKILFCLKKFLFKKKIKR